MAEKRTPWWRRALDFALEGLRTGFGLFIEPAPEAAEKTDEKPVAPVAPKPRRVESQETAQAAPAAKVQDAATLYRLTKQKKRRTNNDRRSTLRTAREEKPSTAKSARSAAKKSRKKPVRPTARLKPARKRKNTRVAPKPRTMPVVEAKLRPVAKTLAQEKPKTEARPQPLTVKSAPVVAKPPAAPPEKPVETVRELRRRVAMRGPSRLAASQRARRVKPQRRVPEEMAATAIPESEKMAELEPKPVVEQRKSEISTASDPVDIFVENRHEFVEEPPMATGIEAAEPVETVASDEEQRSEEPAIAEENEAESPEDSSPEAAVTPAEVAAVEVRAEADSESSESSGEVEEAAPEAEAAFEGSTVAAEPEEIEMTSIFWNPEPAAPGQEEACEVENVASGGDWKAEEPVSAQEKREFVADLAPELERMKEMEVLPNSEPVLDATAPQPEKPVAETLDGDVESVEPAVLGSMEGSAPEEPAIAEETPELEAGAEGASEAKATDEEAVATEVALSEPDKALSEAVIEAEERLAGTPGSEAAETEVAAEETASEDEPEEPSPVESAVKPAHPMITREVTDDDPFAILVNQVYEGPLDLLLDLIRKQDIDIYDIPIARITQQFLTYVNRLKATDVDVAGEFIYMASLLIHIKSKLLLPRAPSGGEDSIEDPRRELVERLLEHERFKNAAQMLLEKQMIEAATWTNPGMREFKAESEAEPEIAADTTDLVRVFQEILDRARNRPVINVEEDTVTVGQMIQFLSRRLTMEDKPIALRRLLSHTRSERALIAMFLALLELVRLQAILLRQDRAFSEIFIKKHTGFEAAMNQSATGLEEEWR